MRTTLEENGNSIAPSGAAEGIPSLELGPGSAQAGMLSPKVEGPISDKASKLATNQVQDEQMPTADDETQHYAQKDQDDSSRFPEISVDGDPAYVTRREQLATKKSVEKPRSKGDKADGEGEEKPEVKTAAKTKANRKRKGATNNDEDEGQVVEENEEPVKDKEVGTEEPKAKMRRCKSKVFAKEAGKETSEADVPDVSAPKRAPRKKSTTLEPTSGSAEPAASTEALEPSKAKAKAKAKVKARAKAKAQAAAPEAKGKAKSKPKSKAKAKARSKQHGVAANAEQEGEEQEDEAGDAAMMDAIRQREASEANPYESLREQITLEVKACLQLCKDSGDYCAKGKHSHAHPEIDCGDDGELQLSTYWSRNAVGIKKMINGKPAQISYFSRTSPCTGTNLLLAKYWVHNSD